MTTQNWRRMISVRYTKFPALANSISRDPDFRASRPLQHEPHPGTTQRAGRRVCARGSRQTAVSQSHTPTNPGGKFVYRTEIIRLQFRVVIEDLLFCHARGEPNQHIPY